MKNLSIKIKRAIRRWLGLGEAFIGVDMGFRDESCVVVVSRLGGGAVRIMDVSFGSQIEIDRFVKECQARYSIPDKDIFWDYPPSMRRHLP
jgi:hypothetical protein